MPKVIKSAEVFMLGLFCYGIIELMFRGKTHIAMGVLGGLSFLFISVTAEYKRGVISGILLSFLNGAFITLLEAVTGYFLNIKLGLDIWDYSELPLNLYGQVCVRFSLFWAMLSFFAMPAARVNERFIGRWDKFYQST